MQDITNIQIRSARVPDARQICDLVNEYAEQGLMLHRSLESIYHSLRDFIVADIDGNIVGCVSVDIFWDDLAEIRSLAVAADQNGRGVGGKLIDAAIKSADKIEIRRLFALTYEKDFFTRRGFEVIERNSLPDKVWTACIGCPKADACDETAVMFKMDTV